MSTITQRKKLSKGTWALIILVFVAVIVVAVMAFLGYISLQFMADWLVGTMMFGTSGWVNAALVLLAPFAGGVIVCYAAYRYFIGQKVTVNTGLGNYTPQGQTVSPQQQGSETVIS